MAACWARIQDYHRCGCPGTGRLNGRSEQLLGRFLREYPGTERTRNGVAIATKLAAYPWRLTGGASLAYTSVR